MYPTNPPTMPDTDTDTDTARALWALRNCAPCDDAPDFTGETLDFLLSIEAP